MAWPKYIGYKSFFNVILRHEVHFPGFSDREILQKQEPHEGSCYSLLGCGLVHVLGVGQAGLAVVPVEEEVEDRAALGGVDDGMLAPEYRLRSMTRPQSCTIRWLSSFS